MKNRFDYWKMSEMNVSENLNITKMYCSSKDCRDDNTDRDDNTGDIFDCDHIEFGGNSPYDDDCVCEDWDCEWNDCDVDDFDPPTEDCFDCSHGGDCEGDDDY